LLDDGLGWRRVEVTDERVASAVANWAPRFVANGVDMNDFQRVTSRVERWEEWCGEWCRLGREHEGLMEEALAGGNYRSAAAHGLRAAMAYHFGKFLFVEYPEEQRAAHERTVAVYRRVLPYFPVPGERVEIPYEGGVMAGILRRPHHVPRPAVVILIPGLDSVKEEMHSYADDLLERGLATLAIDGPGQGEMEYTRPMRHDYEVAARAAIDYLEGRPEVDAGRVGILGVSLGGYYAPRAAAFEPRVQAAVAVSGAFDIPAHFLERPLLTRNAYIARLHARDQGEALAKLRAFTLAGVAERIEVPLLVIAGRKDRLVPAADAERLAREAKRAELWMFEEGNHVVNNLPYRYRPQQADWLVRQLS
jgi:dienelactone hydrolase